MKPQRQSTPSTLSSSRSIRSASSTRCSTFSRPSFPASRLAASTMFGAKSVWISFPSGPIALATMKPVSPVPAASSRTVSPGCGPKALTSHSATGRVTLSNHALSRSQPSAICCQISYEACA